MEKNPIVSAVISMSLDGYIAGENVGMAAPLGVSGSALHEWARDGSAETKQVFAEGGANLGAVICGRRTYDLSISEWKENGPTGEARLPVFVISTEEPDNQLANGVYTFVKDENIALEMAKKAAKGKDISVMGGAKTIQKFLNRGFIDEIQLQLIPIILGGGILLFENMNKQIALKPIEVLGAEKAIHLGFSVEK